VNDTVVELKPKKAKKKGTKGGKKVARGLKQAIERTNEGLAKVEVADNTITVTSDKAGTINVEPYADPIQADAVGAPAYDTQEAYEKAVIADFWPERKPDFAERVAAAVNTSWQRFLYKLPRLVWVDQRVNVSIRLTPEGQIGVFYHSKFNPKAI
jgi:hypothetical protein